MNNPRLSSTTVNDEWRWSWSPTALRQSYAAAIIRTSGPLLFMDLSALVLSVLTAVALLDSPWTCVEKSRFLIPILAATLPAFLAFAGLYPGVAANPAEELRSVVLATTLAFASYAVAAAHMRGALTDWPALALAWLLTLLGITIGRAFVRSVCSGFAGWGFRTAVAGETSAARSAYEALRSHPAQGLRPVAMLPGRVVEGGEADALLGIHYVVFAISEGSLADEALTVGLLRRRFPRVILVLPETAGILGGLSTRAWQCGALRGIEVRDFLLSHTSCGVKRLFDLSLAILASPAFLLLTIVITLLHKATSPGPIFFAQERIGRNGRVFRIWKFRTMVTNANAVLDQHLEQHPHLRGEWQRIQKLSDDPRVTRIGRWLRRTSLDEVPQIWNVFRGEMSLIGPRPIVSEEIERYGDCFDLYARVRPGLTGLWQISGRSRTTYAQRVALDAFYIRNWSVWLDLHVFVRTIRIVLTGDGAV